MGETETALVTRRSIGPALVGALGAVALAGCSQVATEEPIAEVASPLPDALNYAALRAIPTLPSGPTVKAYWVGGRAQEGDGGQGVFVWDGASPALAEDGGTIIKPNDRYPTLPGRWRRVFLDIVDVRWFGASPDPAIDSTEGVVAAIKSARARATVYFPAGTYSVDADRLTAESYVLHAGARLRGELHSSAPISVIRARTVGNVLMRAAVRLVLEDLTLDCAGNADRGLELLTAHGSSLSNVVIKNAKKEGIYTSRISAASGESAVLRFDRVVVEWCGAAGIDLFGPNASLLTHVVAQYNRGPGIRLTGNGSSGAVQVGSIVIVGGVVSLNGKQNWPTLSGPCITPQIAVRGVECGRITGTYLDCDGAPAVELSDRTRGFTLEGIRVGGSSSSSRAFALRGAVACEVSGCNVAGGGYYAGVRIEDAEDVEADDNHVIAGSGLTALTEAPLLVDRVTASGSWNAEVRDASLAADEPPTVGRWREGQIVRNRSPDAGEPASWVCVDGAQNTWLPIHAHELPTSGALSGDVVDASASTVVKVRGGTRRTLGGGYDGKTLTLVSADPSASLELRHMESGSQTGNIHLATASNVVLPPGATLTLVRVTVDSSSGEGWGDSISVATRWREVARST